MLSPISSRRRLTAWLGLLAIWLLVLMPLASQLSEAAAAHRPDAPICAAAQHVDRHELPRDALSACGYCDLLASHAYAPAAAAPADALLHPLVRRVPLLAPAPPPRSFPSLAAPARAPPSLA
ncbi:DUF2946 family protein [Burkholderia gladioli]|uniref:DUF2946 family protein n=1 Tax=Burkholderia gladioli TaxID=28095 RepID=UPI00163F7328|nr:DUF2946 family protein [Burkholderia gladioli]